MSKIKVGCTFFLSLTWLSGPGLKAMNPLEGLNRSVIRLTDKLAPAVVLVESNSYRPSPLASQPPMAVAIQSAAGSGVLISPDGLIVTNAHLVAGATRVQVNLRGPRSSPGKSILPPKGKSYQARVVGLDSETDLALLKIEASKLPYLLLADSDEVRQGQIVLALGNPLGLGSSVSLGVISAVARQLEPEDRMIFLQTDAPVNPGNSGGPLVDIRGNVVGINTLILSQSGGSEGLGFAVPSNIVRSVTGQLRRNGRMIRGDIGVEAQTITPTMATALGLARQSGVILADVTPGGPADSAQLKSGDIVLTLNGKPMENARQFHVNLYLQPVATVVNLEILRGRETISKPIIVLARTDHPDRFASLLDQKKHLVTRLGVLALELDAAVRELLPPLRQDGGILVASPALTPRGPAGIFSAGDVIYSINNLPVAELEGLRLLLSKYGSGETVVMQLERSGRLHYLEVMLD